ncbi:acetyl-CoA carboxylase biotin carboxyl carrier protein [Pseudonocardia endophytica]|uniref:Biotin carboxyl carrier protein of acetyl-CoA carboxylase n=1 Tax=Pseudonocardia endophytica TaxID=401976 RepID=A0A4R1HJP7_PSEEN|nr:acetyl-CoA carboxylase biotin carboxyl carrier protein subunit [Pseudonocardia endophytica]TCK22088.1 acetyl-CoA carboxylase biotin carboxyl carrier protein [Pseudonocardia endophytica]
MSAGTGQNGVAAPAVPTAPDADPGRADVLEQVQRSAVALLTAGGAPPRSLRVQVGDVVVEAEWGRVHEPVAVGPPPASSEPRDAAPPDPGRATVTAPTVGVFYRAPEPGAPPFVSEGDLVRAGQQIGIVEVMKLMMPVESDVAGRVVEFLRADGDSVEFAEPLLVLDPGEV